MTRRWSVGAALVVGLVTVGLIGYASFAGDSSGEDGRGPVVPTGTAEVTRGDMLVYTTLQGQLGYQGQRQVPVQTGGTVTFTPPPGSVLERGDRLAAVNRIPVFLMYGQLPAYRSLATGDEGPDVLQFERNLAALGYTGFDVDDEFTYYTAAAVKQWQEDWGLEETGDVPFGMVHFAPGPMRVAKVDVGVGGPVAAGQAVVALTSDRQVVDVDVPVFQMSLVRGGPKVTVTMPDGSRARGRVVRVGSVVETQGEDEDPTVSVTVRLTGEPRGRNLEATPVDVRFERERRRDVLSVPVNALLAAPSGGYAVVVVDDGRRRRVPVRTGVFSDGRVEVTSDELREGMLVEVPTL